MLTSFRTRTVSPLQADRSKPPIANTMNVRIDAPDFLDDIKQTVQTAREFET